MAAPQNTFDTARAVGNREDLIDKIWNIAPTQTPLVTALARTSATATLHEWQTDTLQQPNPANALIEGADVVVEARTPTVRLTNQCQTMGKSFGVSDIQQVVRSAGRSNDISYQAANAMKELKRDMEAACFANQEKVAGSSSTAARLAGIPTWITTNVENVGTNGSNPTGDGSDARVDGDLTALTQADFNTVMRQIFEEGGEPDTVFLSPENRDVAADFVGMNNQRNTVAGGRVADMIDVYECNHGTVRFVSSRHIRDRDVLVADTSKWALAFLKNIRTYKLPKTGASERRAMDVTFTLVSREEKASGLLADCG